MKKLLWLFVALVLLLMIAWIFLPAIATAQANHKDGTTVDKGIYIRDSTLHTNKFFMFFRVPLKMKDSVYVIMPDSAAPHTGMFIQFDSTAPRTMTGRWVSGIATDTALYAWHGRHVDSSDHADSSDYSDTSDYARNSNAIDTNRVAFKDKNNIFTGTLQTFMDVLAQGSVTIGVSNALDGALMFKEYNNTYTTNLYSTTASSDKYINLPNLNGTIALTSDIKQGGMITDTNRIAFKDKNNIFGGTQTFFEAVAQGGITVGLSNTLDGAITFKEFNNSYTTTLSSTTSGSSKFVNLPNADGTLALFTDIKQGGMITDTNRIAFKDKPNTFLGNPQTFYEAIAQGGLTTGLSNTTDGSIIFKEYNNSYSTTLSSTTASVNKFINLPNTSGTLALTSQLVDTKWDGGSTDLVPATGRASLGLGTASLVDSNRVAFKDKDNTFTGTQTFFSIDAQGGLSTGTSNAIDGSIVFKEYNNAFSTTLSSTTASSSKFISLPNVDGTVITTGNLSSITAVGTIASGTWQGTSIGYPYFSAYGDLGNESKIGSGSTQVAAGNHTQTIALGGTNHTSGYTDAQFLAYNSYYGDIRSSGYTYSSFSLSGHNHSGVYAELGGSYSNPSWIATLAGSKITGQGTGGGFDADFLDGFHATVFATSGHNHTGVYAPVSHLHPGRVISKTASYVITETEDYLIVLVDPASTTSITLPSASTHSGQMITVKRTSSAPNTLTVIRGGSDTMEGSTSITLASIYNSRTFASGGGTVWYIVSSN